MYDVIIIGAGAAGLLAAGAAAEAGCKTLLVEKMEKAGRKIRITGKGRCNITNTREREEFLEKIRVNTDFFRPSFERFDNQSTLDLLKEQGLRLDFERGGRVFPASGKAWDVADTLVDWAREKGAEIQYHTRVTEITVLMGKVRGVKVITKKGYQRNLECGAVIICTGGVSYPATGSTGDGYIFANSAGHGIVEVRPALVPLSSRSTLAKQLIGLQLKNVNISLYADGEKIAEEFGEMEFTKRGIEGAVILRLSRQAVDALIEEKKVELSIDVKPALEAEILSARIDREIEAMEGEGAVGDLIRKLVPKPMVGPLCFEMGFRPSFPVKSFGESEKETVIRILKDIRFPVDDYGTFDEAIVTAGGVDISQIDPETLESRLVKGLYFAGEVLDIDADTGGFNLQVAFSTGYNAGKSAARQLK